MSSRIGPKKVRLVSYLAFMFAIVTAFVPVANAADDVVSVFDVRKTLPLDPSDPVYYDYYVNAGPEAGLKRGMYVSVVRRTPIHDPVQNKAQATLAVEVAKVQIIHVDRNIGVARLVTEFGSEDRPVMEYESIMIGDTLDLTTVSMDAPKDREKRKKRTPSSNASAESATPSQGTVSIPVPALVPEPVPVTPAAPVKESEKPTRPQPQPQQAPTKVENPFPASPVPDMVRAADDDVHT